MNGSIFANLHENLFSRGKIGQEDYASRRNVNITGVQIGLIERSEEIDERQ